MTNQEIYETIGVPLTTQKDWEQRTGWRSNILALLSSVSVEEAKAAINKKPLHRLSHILNRNIVDSKKFGYEEIRQAFQQEDYSKATDRQRFVYSRFFKECDPEDLETLCDVYKVSKRNVKKLYETSTEWKFKGVAIKWDRRFRIAHKRPDPTRPLDSTPPKYLRRVLERKELKSV